MRIGNIVGGLAALGVAILIALSVIPSNAPDTPAAPTLLPLRPVDTTTTAPTTTTSTTSPPTTTTTSTTRPPTTTSSSSTSTSTTSSTQVPGRLPFPLLVVRAGGPEGIETFVKQVLSDQGFNVGATQTVPEQLDFTLIMYRAGYREQALQVGNVMRLDPEFVVEGLGESFEKLTNDAQPLLVMMGKK